MLCRMNITSLLVIRVELHDSSYLTGSRNRERLKGSIRCQDSNTGI